MFSNDLFKISIAYTILSRSADNAVAVGSNLRYCFILKENLFSLRAYNKYLTYVLFSSSIHSEVNE